MKINNRQRQKDRHRCYSTILAYNILGDELHLSSLVGPEVSLPCQPVSNLCPIRGVPRLRSARPVGRVAG